jgi:hypothetical protein
MVNIEKFNAEAKLKYHPLRKEGDNIGERNDEHQKRDEP